MATFEDLAITGELILGMPEAERWFEIIGEPVYEPYPTPEDPSGQKNQKLAIPVSLSNGAKGTYYPNRTSARKIATLTRKTEMKDWMGGKFFWGSIPKQKIGANLKDVLYITEVWPRVQKPV